MKITWYGHSCFRIDTGASRILIDPFLTGNPTFVNSGVAYSSVTEGVTHVALTHGHDDHIGDAAQICVQTGATLIAVYEIAMYLAGQGVEKLEPGNTGGRISQADFDLNFVHALHSSGTTVDGKSIYLGNPCGLVIRPESGPSVYHMGDTEVFSDMALIQELHAPEIGIVPIGDRFTMGAASAAFACRRFFRFRKVLPCHYGTFPMLAATADDFMAEASGLDVMVPAPGEVLEF